MSLYDLGDVAKLRLTTSNSAGDPADAGDVTLAITKPDGTVVSKVLADLTHTPGTGIYDYLHATDLIGPHKVAWTATGANQSADVRFFDVYGATIAEPADLRARYSGGGNGGDLSSTAAYPEAVLRKALRDAVEQWNELAKVSMAPFSHRLTLLGDGRCAWNLPDVEVRTVVSLRIGGTLIDPAMYVVDGQAGILELRAGTFTKGQPVVVHYEHGYDRPPGTVVDAVMQRAAELAIPSLTPARATGQTGELGYTRFSIAGRDGSTGIPDFDSTATLFGRQAAVGVA